MLRALIDLLVTVFVVVVGRAILTSVLKSVATNAMGAFQNQAPQDPAGANRRGTNRPPAPEVGGELHKDPVCGTYVAESAALRQQIGGRMFFYCSEECRRKHNG